MMEEIVQDTKQKLVFATENPGKLREVRALLAELPYQVLTPSDFPDFPQVEETGLTFRENALLKAVTAANYTGYLSLADDSGLEVDYLEGAPGVRSARFAGEPKDDSLNNQLLLGLLLAVPKEKRSARFRCVVAIADPQGAEELAEGTLEGRIGTQLVGTDGFGYDPLFILPESGLTLAQLNLEQKNQISHRAKAMKQAYSILRDRLQ